jgi:hypothetical protein
MPLPLGTVAVLKTAAEDVHQDRQPLLTRFRRRPHVQIEAVLAHPIAAKPIVGGWRGPLHAARAELVGFAYALPVLHRLWFPPAQISDRRLRKRDSLEATNTGTRLDRRLDESIGGLDAIAGVRRSSQRRAETDRNDERDDAIQWFHKNLREHISVRISTSASWPSWLHS